MVEYVMALGIAGLLLTVLVGLSLFTGNSFAVTSHLADLDQANRLALDTISREIRQADKVLDCGRGAISFQSGTNTFSYAFNSRFRTITRTRNGEDQVLLRDCDYARYDLYRRNATNGTYDLYPAANPDSCKVVQLTWLCSRRFLGRTVTTAHQSAKVVIRKQR